MFFSYKRKLDHNKSELTQAINEYLSNLPIDERRLLKDEITYDLKFKEDFGSRLNELSKMLGALCVNNYEIFNKLSINFIDREHSQNPHIIKMYNFYMDNIFEGLAEMYGQEISDNAFHNMKSVMEKSKIYYELQESLDNNSSANKVLKI
jgi:hypothetical protein